jgi:hypothetical protein
LIFKEEIPMASVQQQIRTYLRLSGMSDSKFSREATDNPNFVNFYIKKGKEEIPEELKKRVLKWMEEHPLPEKPK